jgi:hypothetical protein
MTTKIERLKKWCLVILLAFTPMLQAQVTVGGDTPPQEFSILEILSNGKGGLRLPRLTNDQQKTLTESQTFKDEIIGKGKGLTIYNISIDCVEYWNGTKWISLCSDNASFEGGHCAESPIPSTGGSTSCAITDSNCDTEGEYTFTFVMGSDFATIEVTDAGAGEFTLSFEANDRASDRQSIVMVTSPCGASNMLVFTQEGDTTGCGTTTVPSIKSVGGTAMCGSGAAYLYLEGYPATGTFIWTLNGQQVGTGYSYTATVPGKYIVYGDKIGCSHKQEFQLTLDGTGAPDPVSIVVQGNNGLVCDPTGTTKLIAAKPTTGIVRWFKNGVLQSLTSPDNEIEAGVGEWFAVVNEGTCWSTPSETVTVAVDPNSGAQLTEPVIVKPAAFCAGGSVQLSVSDATYNASYTYTWYENNTQIGTGKTILYNVPSGISSVVIRCRATLGGSCASEAIGIETVTTGTIPARPTITGDKQLCSGIATLNAVASGAGSFTYQWYKNEVPYANTQSITVNEGGEYAVTVTDGCTSPAAKITLSNTSSAVPTVTLNRSAENPNQGDMVTYAASINFTPATNYTWTITNGTLMSGGGNTANAVVKFENTGAASVKVEVSNACGTGEATHSIANVGVDCALPVTVTPSAAVNKTTIVGQQVTLDRVSATFAEGSPTAVYQWYSNTTASTTGGTGISGATNNTYTPPAYTSTGTYYYYCVVKNSCQPAGDAGMATGLYTVTVSDPASKPVGSGIFTGTMTCFDVVETNFGGTCGTREARLSQKADFSQTATNTQIYTFKTNGTDKVSKIRFYAVDQTGLVIESITPQSTAWESGTNLSGEFKLTVKYKTDLNTTAAGLGRDQALNATLYVVYNSDATGASTTADKRLELKISVQDCVCCPGYLAVGGEYAQKTAGYLTTIASGSKWTAVSAKFTATGKDVCFYKTDAVNTSGTSTTQTWNQAVGSNGCGNGYVGTTSYIDPEHRAMGWRLPSVAELGALQSIHAALSTQPTSAPGTANLHTDYYWSRSEYSGTYAWGWNFRNQYALYATKTDNNYVRCVRSF